MRLGALVISRRNGKIPQEAVKLLKVGIGGEKWVGLVCVFFYLFSSLFPIICDMSALLPRVLQHLDVLHFWAATLQGEEIKWEEKQEEKFGGIFGVA